MEITRSLKREEWAYKKIGAWLTRRPRSGDAWHVSDLIYPRKALFQRLDPKPITNKQSLYFIVGHGHHHVIEAILGPKKTGERTDAGEFLKKGIYFSPDLREEVMNFPIEIKTSRAQKAPDDSGQPPKKAFEGYLKQLCAYMALMNKKLGMLMVLYLNKVIPDGKPWQKEPALRFYKVKMKPSERKAKVAELVALSKTLTSCVKKKSPKGLDLCPEWLCRDCAWFKQCKPWTIDPKRKGIQKK
jgi:hypothetical protein